MSSTFLSNPLNGMDNMTNTEEVKTKGDETAFISLMEKTDVKSFTVYTDEDIKHILAVKQLEVH